MFNQVLIQGRVTGIYNVKDANTEKRRCRLCIACDDNTKEKNSNFFFITCFKNQYDYIKNYINVGDMLLVEGRLKDGSYINQNTGERIFKTEIIANSFTYLQASNAKKIKYRIEKKLPVSQEERTIYQKYIDDSIDTDGTDIDDLPFSKQGDYDNSPKKTNKNGRNLPAINEDDLP